MIAAPSQAARPAGPPGRDWRALLALAAPIALSTLSYQLMAVIDALLLGRTSAAAVGAVSLGAIAVLALSSLGLGVAGALQLAAANASGARDLARRHASLAA